MTATTAMLFEKKVHPMVPVPNAIRIVLGETAAKMLEEGAESSSETISSSDYNLLLGRRLTQDIMMAEPGYPTYDASIMDGYAIQSTEKFSKEGEWTHAVVAKVFAGDAALAASSALAGALPSTYYITTGAVIPQNCDCVVPIEQCKVSDDGTKIFIEEEAALVAVSGKWIRPVGCDMAAQSVVLPKGHIIDPVSLGLLLQSGQKAVQVQKKLQVGVLSTGNELLSTNEHQAFAGKIPDVNRPILLALLSTFGAGITPIDLGMQRDDDLESLSVALKAALDKCDVVITTGGISMGESDVLEQVLVGTLGGKVHFGRLHMKPGKPTTFITTASSDNRTCFVFCMPGNPVSATVCTQLLVRPCLDMLLQTHSTESDAALLGKSVDEKIHHLVEHAWVHPERTATLAHDMKLDKERPEYHRVILSNDIMASSTGVQRSSRLMSLRDAQGLLVLPQGAVGKLMQAKAGEEFTVLLLNNSNESSGMQVKKSQHLNKKTKKSLRIAVVNVVDPKSCEKEEDMSTRNDALKKVAVKVQSALSGTKSGVAEIVASKTFCGSADDLFESATTSTTGEKQDVIVVVCQSSFPGSFLYQLDVAACLRQRLVKVADTMALQARRGVASENAASALLETVVGYYKRQPSDGHTGVMLILVPEEGLEGGLSNVRGLLKHALQVARGI